MKKKMIKKWLPHIIAVGAFAVFIVLGLACASAPPEGAVNGLAWGDRLFENGNYDSAIAYYNKVIEDYPKTPQAKEAREKIAEAQRRKNAKEQQGAQEQLTELIQDGDRYFAKGKDDWEAEKRFTGNWNSWRRDSVDYLRRATQNYNEALIIDPNNALAQQRLANARQLEAEIQAADKQGFVRLQSEIAGVVLLNGGQTDFTVTAESSVLIVIDNANGVYEVAVKDGTGKVFPASSKVTINGTGLRNTYSSTVINPNPAPSSGDDFDIRQNAQGGITITGYKGTRTQVVIPDTISGIKVTEIAAGAFSNKRIRTVAIPNTVTKIGERAFANISSLISVVLPNAITMIPKWAFSDCILETINIPNSVTAIDEGAFADNKLTSVTFGNRVAEIGPKAFAGNKLTVLTNLPVSLRTIYPNAFANNGITTLNIPNGVTLLMKDSFEGNPIRTLVIPPSLAKFTQETVSYGIFTEIHNESVAGFGWAFSSNKDDPTAITLPANVDDDNLSRNFSRTFLDFYKSQSKKAGTYSFDGRLWTVK